MHSIIYGTKFLDRNRSRRLRHLEPTSFGLKVRGPARCNGLVSLELSRHKSWLVENNNFGRNQAISQKPWLRPLLLRGETGVLYRRAQAVVGCSEGVAEQAGRLFGIAQDKLHAIANRLDCCFYDRLRWRGPSPPGSSDSPAPSLSLWEGWCRRRRSTI